jgi:hypothetical protein
VSPVFTGWMILAFPIGWTVSRLTAALLFYGLFTPLGLFFRLTGRDVLTRRHRPDRSTYWQPKPVASDVRRYFHQF